MQLSLFNVERLDSRFSPLVLSVHAQNMQGWISKSEPTVFNIHALSKMAEAMHVHDLCSVFGESVTHCSSELFIKFISGHSYVASPSGTFTWKLV